MTLEDESRKFIGRELGGKYRLSKLLGVGGMGAVFEAEHVILHHKVAVKILHAVYSTVPEAVERFVREAQTASAIGHPNIIKAIDFGTEEDNTTYIVLELLHGKSLEQLLAEKRTLSPNRSISIILQVLSALHAAHSKGILHRDLKPDNIFMAVDDRDRQEVKLLDFGVAKFMNTDQKDDSLSLTKTGTVLGTPYYLSPEQARGRKEIDERIDIWSAGVILYEILSGELPFDGDNYNEIMGKILLEEPEPLVKLAPDTPPLLIKVVEKAMTKDVDARYRYVSEMITDLIPLHDNADDDMTTTATRALMSSIAPPPYVEDDSTKNASTSAGAKSTKVEKPIETLEQSAYELTDSEKPTSFFKKVRLVGFAAVVVIAAAVILLTFQQVWKDEPSQKAQSHLLSRERKPAPDPITAQTQGDASVQPEKSLLDTISIELKGLPPKATVSVDGNELTTPYSLPRSTDKVEIEISAPGFVAHTQSIIPTEDLAIEVFLEQEKASKKKPWTNKKSKSRKKKKKKNGEVWSENPFG
jgi:serine/threonine protein kinase